MQKIFWPLVAVLLLVGWIAIGPFLTVRAIQRAADQDDAALLADNVDFPVLRKNLKPQLSPRLAAKLDKKAAKNPFLAALSDRYSGDIADSAVDTLITPQFVAKLLNEEGRKPKHKKKKHGDSSADGSPDNTQQAKDEQQKTETTWRFNSISEFEADVRKGNKVTSFILTRYGLGWKLTNIILPPQ